MIIAAVLRGEKGGRPTGGVGIMINEGRAGRITEKEGFNNRHLEVRIEGEGNIEPITVTSGYHPHFRLAE